MFISISYVGYVFLYNTIKWPYQPKHSHSYNIQYKYYFLSQRSIACKIRVMFLMPYDE